MVDYLIIAQAAEVDVVSKIKRRQSIYLEWKDSPWASLTILKESEISQTATKIAGNSVHHDFRPSDG